MRNFYAIMKLNKRHVTVYRQDLMKFFHWVFFCLFMKNKEEYLMNFSELAKHVLKSVGGQENVQQLNHCATRLRFNLKDYDLVDVERLKSIKGVMEVNKRIGELQVVIGSDVASAYRELNKLLGSVSNSGEEIVEKKKKISVSGLIDTISGIFSPILPALCGSAMLKVVLILLTSFNLIAEDTTTYYILSYASDAIFYFLPIFLAFTAARKFNCNPFLAVVLACCLVHPNFIALNDAEGPITLFGLPVTMATYTSSVLPIIFSVWIMSYVDQFAEKFTPKVVRFFIKPLIVLLIMLPLTLVVIGPLGSLAGNYFADFVVWMQTKANWAVVIIMSTLSPLLVIAGMHYALFPLAFQSLMSSGFTVILGVDGLSSNLGQGGACFAVALKTKNEELRQLAISAGLTACFGISEPALYGVTLKLKKPFWAVLISGFLGGVVAAITGLKMYAFVSPGLMAFPAFMVGGFVNSIAFVACCLTAFISAFVITMFLGFEDIETDQINNDKKGGDSSVLTTSNTKLNTVVSPLKGTSVPLGEVNDTIFSNEVMGTGVAIQPVEGIVKSPVNGVVSATFETAHAIGITEDNGLELLIHIGIDTNNLKGEGFQMKVSKGDAIKVGQDLIEFDINKMKEAGYDVITPVIFTNINEGDALVFQYGEVDFGSQFVSSGGKDE